MAFDNFIGWTQPKKIELLLALQEAKLTGPVVRAPKPGGGYTEFDVSKIDYNQMLRELEYSIANDAAYDSTDAIQAACAANQRPGVTIPIFYYP